MEENRVKKSTGAKSVEKLAENAEESGEENGEELVENEKEFNILFNFSL